MVAALAAAFLFRLAFGLASEFWFEDETQIFLLGLNAHSTGRWPLYGPDVVWTKSQIPGALQALLVAAPMDLVAVPEAPFVLLNLLSMAALVLLAWYVSRRLPDLPKWLVWGWPLFLPWTLHYSTHVVNPSYVLLGSVVFFVGFLEAFVPTRGGVLSHGVAHFMTGFGVLWVLQIHMSWVLLVPFAALAVAGRAVEGPRAVVAAILWTTAGALAPGALLLPTFLTHGLAGGAGDVQRNLRPHLVSPAALLTTLARFLSFASLEVGRFVAITRSKRDFLLLSNPWLIPLGLVTAAAGIVHPLLMAALWFRRSPRPEWRPLRWLCLGTVVFIYASYFLAHEPPQAHAFYVVAPLAIVYAFYAWTLVDSPRMRRVAAAVLAVSIAFHAALAVARAPERWLYRNRAVPALAVATRTPWLFAHRRPYARDAREDPAYDPEGALAGDAVRDVDAADVAWTRPRGLSVWSVTLRNHGIAAYRDLKYVCFYRDAAGGLVRQSGGIVPEILQPGEARRVAAIVDGRVAPPVVRAELRLVGGEKLLPVSGLTGRPSGAAPRH